MGMGTGGAIMNTWIVIAAYNEGTVIRGVVEGVKKQYQNVVVTDDSSTDSTADEARAAGAIVLEHLINRGQGAALKTGITYALRQGAEAVVTFDADGQHDPNEIAALLEPLEKNEVDIVLGSRFIKSGSNVPPLRRMALKAGILFTRVMSRINVTDTHNGFRAMNRVAAEKIKIVQDRMAHASEILDEIVYHKLRYKEVPVTITYSYYSKEKGQKTSALFKIAFKILAHKLTH